MFFDHNINPLFDGDEWWCIMMYLCWNVVADVAEFSWPIQWVIWINSNSWCGWATHLSLDDRDKYPKDGESKCSILKKIRTQSPFTMNYYLGILDIYIMHYIYIYVYILVCQHARASVLEMQMVLLGRNRLEMWPCGEQFFVQTISHTVQQFATMEGNPIHTWCSLCLCLMALYYFSRIGTRIGLP